MNTALRRLIGTLALSLSALTSLPALAGPYTNLFVFGDSLSDTGNLSIATGGAQPPPGQPYFNGRFSDGPVWVETLAAGLGLAADAAPFLAGGKNYAFAGARTGMASPPPGVLAQVAGIWGANPATMADPNALFVVVGGGNDMRDARTAFQTNSAAHQASRQAAAAAAANNLLNSLGFLASRGAKHVLISNLPDLGFTPEAALFGLQFSSSDVSARFNALIAGIEAYAETHFGLDVDVLDMAGLSGAIRNDALNNGGAVYGITNVVAPCAGFAFSLGAACNVSLFSDALHPSALAHAILGRAALALVPLPGTAWLAGLALLGLVALRRRG